MNPAYIKITSSNTQINILTGSYVFLATIAVLAYDFLLDLDYEVDYWTSQRMSFTGALYFLCRTFSFVAGCVRIPIVFLPTIEKLNKMECTVIDHLDLWILVMVLVCAEGIFAARTYALWGCSKRILYLLVGSYLVVVTGAFVCIGLYGAAIDRFGGCASKFPPNSQRPLMAGYILLVVLEIEVFVLSVYRALILYRESRGTLLVLLLRHNVGYFSAALALNGINMIDALGVWTNDNAMTEVSQILLQGLLATRMHIHLWNSYRDQNNSLPPVEDLTLMQFAGERDRERSGVSDHD